MGMWIELGVFGLVFVFAWHQLRDLKRERLKRERQKAEPRKKYRQLVALWMCISIFCYMRRWV